MSEVPVKKKHQSGSEKRKKRQEQQNKLNEQLKKTQNLFELGFSRELKEHQPHDTPSTSSTSHKMEVDPVEVPFEQIGQDQETPTLVSAEEGEAETGVIHQNVVHLGVEYQNDIGLWQNITNEMQDFWCTRDPNECQHFDCNFSASARHVSDTRWCARADATKALATGYNSFQKALQSIASDETQTSQAIHEAKCLLNDLRKKENAVMAVFWAAILDRINGVSISLQKKTIELRTAVDLLKSLLDFLISQRDLFDDYETKANEKSDTQYSDENQRERKRKRHHDDGSAEEVVLRGQEKLKVDTYLPVLDMLFTELSRRLEAYREINDLFGFLTDFSTKSDAEIRQACTKFKDHYFEDIEPEFIDEMVQYKYFILQLDDAGQKNMPAEESYKLIIEKKFDFHSLAHSVIERRDYNFYTPSSLPLTMIFNSSINVK
ncbi:hypothetical protein ACJJTC_014022 [Scirpophaga incertulas]